MVLTLYLFVNSHNKIMIPWEGHFCIEFPFADNKCWNVQLVFSFEQGHWMSMIQYNESSLLQNNGQLQLVKLFLQWSLPPHNEPKRSYWVIKVNTHHFSNWSVYFRVSKCIFPTQDKNRPKADFCPSWFTNFALPKNLCTYQVISNITYGVVNFPKTGAKSSKP